MRRPPEDTRAKHIIDEMRKGRSRAFSLLRERKLLHFFKEACRSTPAYRRFLAKAGVRPSSIRSFADLISVPPINKPEYLRKYRMRELYRKGSIEKPIVFSATSGSTGKPYYFPHDTDLDWEYSILAEHFLRNSSHGTGGPILVIVAFGMGVWIGGIHTYKAFEIAARRLGNISVITPGINKREIFNALRELAPQYKEVVIAGYPPFIKDVLDEASDNDINLSKLRVRLLFAAEPFSEKFRDYVLRKVGGGDPHLDTLNIYGSVELGAMAFETPTSILVRRLAVRDRPLLAALFPGARKLPTLAQYNPRFVGFEESTGEVLVTGGNMLPLVRYAIGDAGGIFSFDEVATRLREYGVDLRREAKRAGIGAPCELPFVYVYERNDMSTTLYGLQIYPEHVREALLHRSVNPAVTGRFTMATRSTRRHDQYLEINIELRRGMRLTETLRRRLLARITATLETMNSEFRELRTHLGERAMPKVVLWKAGDRRYFGSGGKQKWVAKSL